MGMTGHHGLVVAVCMFLRTLPVWDSFMRMTLWCIALSPYIYYCIPRGEVNLVNERKKKREKKQWGNDRWLVKSSGRYCTWLLFSAPDSAPNPECTCDFLTCIKTIFLCTAPVASEHTCQIVQLLRKTERRRPKTTAILHRLIGLSICIQLPNKLCKFFSSDCFHPCLKWLAFRDSKVF